MKRGLNELALPAPEFAFARPQPVAHQNSQHDVGLAFLLIFGVTLDENLLRQLRRAEDHALADCAFDARHIAIFLDPFWKLPQRIALRVINRAQKPVARAGDERWQALHVDEIRPLSRSFGAMLSLSATKRKSRVFFRMIMENVLAICMGLG